MPAHLIYVSIAEASEHGYTDEQIEKAENIVDDVPEGSNISLCTVAEELMLFWTDSESTTLLGVSRLHDIGFQRDDIEVYAKQ